MQRCARCTGSLLGGSCLWCGWTGEKPEPVEPVRRYSPIIVGYKPCAREGCDQLVPLWIKRPGRRPRFHSPECYALSKSTKKPSSDVL